MALTDDQEKELKATHDKALADQKAEYEKLKADLEKKNAPPADDLQKKAALDREAKEKNSSDAKALESAVRFELSSKDWLKTNESVLPSSIGSLFEAAAKETYDSPIEKDRAIKAGIVQEFFAIQTNVDLLTPGQKTALEDFLKLTKTGKQQRAQQVFEMVFEPGFEMLKQTRKADQIKKGESIPSDVEAAYRKRLEQGSRKHYLGEKNA